MVIYWTVSLVTKSCKINGKQDEYPMDPAYGNLFKIQIQVSESYFSKTVKYCPAISKVDSYGLQYIQSSKNSGSKT